MGARRSPGGARAILMRWGRILLTSRGVCDGGENPHAVCTARTDPGVSAVDLCAEAGPGGGGAPMLDRPGAILAVRRRWPGEGRQAQEVGRAFPGSAGAG